MAELSVEIRYAETLTKEEWQALFGWGENIFGLEDANYTWRPKPLHFITEEDGHPLSHVGIVKTSVRVGGRELTVGGIGGVATRPEAQGRHLVHAAMRQAAEFICHELGAEFGMLFCLPRLEPFYARQGWQALEDEVEIDQPVGKVVWPTASWCGRAASECGPWGASRSGGCPGEECRETAGA